jgi:hypothetical protein
MPLCERLTLTHSLIGILLLVTDGERLTRSSYLDSAKRLALATGAATYGWEDLTKAPVSPSILINLRRRSQRSLDHIGFRKFGREVRLDG